MSVSISRHRFSTDDYHRMAACGILGESDRVELLDGEIIEMTPIGPRHHALVDRLTDRLVAALSGRAIVRIQGSIRLDLRSEPQPDVAVLRYRPDFYADRFAGPDDVLFLVEVGDSSVDFDREVKLPLYARAGIAEVWLASVPDAWLSVHRGLAGGAYREVAHLRRGDVLTLPAFPDVTIALVDLLG